MGSWEDWRAVLRNLAIAGAFVALILLLREVAPHG